MFLEQDQRVWKLYRPDAGGTILSALGMNQQKQDSETRRMQLLRVSACFGPYEHSPNTQGGSYESRGGTPGLVGTQLLGHLRLHAQEEGG